MRECDFKVQLRVHLPGQILHEKYEEKGDRNEEQTTQNIYIPCPHGTHGNLRDAGFRYHYRGGG